MELKIEASDDRIRGLLCCAFEGGSNCWYQNLDWECDDPAVTSQDLIVKDDRNSSWHWPYTAPFRLDCRLTLEIKEEDPVQKVIITREKLERGLQIFADAYPRHYGDFVAENDDANTGDVFLQCVCFGEVIYG